MASQTYYLYDGMTMPQLGVDPGEVLFDSSSGLYPPAVAMRFQLGEGNTEACYVHVEGFHNKNGSVDEADWEKALVGYMQPLELLYRNPSRLTEGLITKVYGWSSGGGGTLCWTPIAKF